MIIPPEPWLKILVFVFYFLSVQFLVRLCPVCSLTILFLAAWSEISYGRGFVCSPSASVFDVFCDA